MGAIEDQHIYGIQIRESANDGSDFTNPDADYRLAFLGEDGLWHVKDSAGTVTNPFSSAGSVATDAIWDAAGDLAVGTGANTAARLAIGATNGMALQRVSGAVAWAFPPGYEFDYAELTGGVTINGANEAGATTILTGNAVTYDGSTIVVIEAYFPLVTWVPDDNTRFWLYDGSSSIGEIGRFTRNSGANAVQSSVILKRRLTPSAAAHTYGIRASSPTAGSGNVNGGAGGAGNLMPGFIRITKV